MKTSVNTILYFFQLIFLCKCYYIQKCCDRRKQLAQNFDTCVDFDGNKGIEKYDVNDNNHDKDGIHLVKANENFTHHIWWLPPDIKFVSSKTLSGHKLGLEKIPFTDLTDIEFLDNTMYPCPSSEREIVPFNDYVFILENGSLLIRNIEDNVRPKTTIFPYTSYCLDRVERYSYLLDHSFAILLCPCLYMPCVRMCCRWKHFLNFTKAPEACEYSNHISLKWNLRYKDDTYEEKSKFPEQFGIIQDMPKCEQGEYHLNENSNSSKKFWVLPNGNIKAEGHLLDINFKDYCIHYWNSNGSFQTNLRICKTPFEDSKLVHDSILYGTYYSVGAAFLALTLLIYMIVKDLRRTLHSYYLICHLISVFISSLTMAINEFFWLLPTNFCIIVAYIIHFSSVSAILWLNVMCIDISNTFRAFNGSSNKFNLPRNSIKSFLFYSTYAWGVSSTITFITFIADNTPLFDKPFRPEFGIRKCWFFGSLAMFIYFYLPISLILIYNLYLFLCTSRKIFKLQKDSKRLFNQGNRHLGTNDVKKEKHRMVLYAKLFALMGLTWIFDILSWIIDSPPYYWYLTDAINASRGLFIFLIFCCKKKVLLSFFNTCFNISGKLRRNTESNVSTKTNSTCATSVMSKSNSIQLEVLDGASNESNLDYNINNDNGGT